MPHNHHPSSLTAVFKLSEALFPGNAFDVANKIIHIGLFRNDWPQQSFATAGSDGREEVCVGLGVVENEGVAIKDLTPSFVWSEGCVGPLGPYRDVLGSVWPVCIEVLLQQACLGASVVVYRRRGRADNGVCEDLVDHKLTVVEGFEDSRIILLGAYDVGDPDIGFAVDDKFDIEGFEDGADRGGGILFQLGLGEVEAENDGVPQNAKRGALAQIDLVVVLDQFEALALEFLVIDIRANLGFEILEGNFGAGLQIGLHGGPHGEISRERVQQTAECTRQGGGNLTAWPSATGAVSMVKCLLETSSPGMGMWPAGAM